MRAVILVGRRRKGLRSDTTICQAEISADAQGHWPRSPLTGQMAQDFATAFATILSATYAFAQPALGGQPTHYPCPIILDPANRAA